jgi:hypothetical protein
MGSQVAQPGGDLRPDEHAVIGEAVRYLRSLARCNTDEHRARVRRRYPELASAHAIYTEAGVIRDEVEARLLAYDPVSEVADETKLPAGVVTKYADIFFRLPRKGTGHDWIVFRVIRMFEWRDREPSEDDAWRYMGLAGGRGRYPRRRFFEPSLRRSPGTAHGG